MVMELTDHLIHRLAEWYQNAGHVDYVATRLDSNEIRWDVIGRSDNVQIHKVDMWSDSDHKSTLCTCIYQIRSVDVQCPVSKSNDPTGSNGKTSTPVIIKSYDRLRPCENVVTCLSGGPPKHKGGREDATCGVPYHHLLASIAFLKRVAVIKMSFRVLFGPSCSWYTMTIVYLNVSKSLFGCINESYRPETSRVSEWHTIPIIKM